MSRGPLFLFVVLFLLLLELATKVIFVAFFSASMVNTVVAAISESQDPAYTFFVVGHPRTFNMS